jgi:hypothetical protein
MSDAIKFTTTAKVSTPQGLASVTTNPIILVSDGKLIGDPSRNRTACIQCGYARHTGGHPMTAPERIWVVEAEESVSRDETGQLFADYDKAGLTALAKCYEADPTKYTRTDIHQAALDRIAELEGALRSMIGGKVYVPGFGQYENEASRTARAVLAKGDG